MEALFFLLVDGVKIKVRIFLITMCYCLIPSFPYSFVFFFSQESNHSLPLIWFSSNINGNGLFQSKCSLISDFNPNVPSKHNNGGIFWFFFVIFSFPWFLSKISIQMFVDFVKFKQQPNILAHSHSSSNFWFPFYTPFDPSSLWILVHQWYQSMIFAAANWVGRVLLSIFLLCIYKTLFKKYSLVLLLWYFID